MSKDAALAALRAKEHLRGRLDAFREIHEHWELEESMTEAEFDQWLHDEMRRLKKELAGRE